MNTQTDTHEPGAYDLRGLALRCGVSLKAVTKWHQAGRIPGGFRAGKSVRFDKVAVEKRLLSGSLLLEKV